MPLYEYECDPCGVFGDYKSIKDYQEPSDCPTCGKSAPRILTFRGHFVGASVESPEYNPGLGCVVNNKKHREEICKQRGLVEIGNEKPKTVRKNAQRERQERLSKPYLTGEQLWQMKDTIRSK